jgi:predicted dehydrogenase
MAYREENTAMAGASIGVGVVGTGFGQKIHIPGLQAHHRTEVVAVYHRDLTKAQAIAQQFGIPYACQTVEELATLSAVDAVAISTPPFLHHAMATTVLHAGKHLLLEKPTALNQAEAEAIAHLSETKGLITTLDFEFRFVPAWQRFAELLQEGIVGQPRLIQVNWLVSGRADPSRPWNWYARKDQGGGALGAIGSHAFDYIAWLFSPVRRLCGRLSTAIATRPDPVTGEAKPVDADDTCTILLELQDGTPCQMSLSAVTYQGRGHWVEVYGDRGTLILGSNNQADYVHGFRIWMSQAGAPLTEVEIPQRLEFPKTYPDGRLAPFIRVVNHWVEDIDRGVATAPSIREGVYSQQLMDATHQSNATGQWVDIQA